MRLLKGKIDFGTRPERVDPPSPPVVTNGMGCIDLPGVSIQYDARQVDCVVSKDRIILVTGAPRHKETRRRIRATDWLAVHDEDVAPRISLIDDAFSLVLIDLSRQCAQLIVDRFCIETLCFQLREGMLGFSDQASDAAVETHAIRTQSIYDYLYFHDIPSPQTIFRDVHRLGPGEHLSVADRQASVRRWWTPAFVENDHSALHSRQERFLKLLEQSVAEAAEQTRAACFLSGGTDSSTVAGMLAKLQGSQVDCFSIGFDAAGYDEMEYSRIAARHFGLRLHEYYVTPKDLAESMGTIAASYDQPFGNSSVLPAYYCARTAREAGHEVILAGDGGDELFGGNARYAMQMLFDWYNLVPKSIRGNILEPLAHRNGLFRKAPGLKQLGGYIRHSSIPMPDRMEAFNLLHRIGPAVLLSPEFIGSVDMTAPLKQQQSTYHEVVSPSLLNRMLAYDWKYTLADSDLPKVRGATQLAGIPVGYPLLSSSLTDFSLSLPPEWKLKRQKLRWFFKAALRDFLPEQILTKKKHGFGLPFGPWLMRAPILQEMAYDALKSFAARGILKADTAEALPRVYLPKAPGYYGEVIWILMMAEYWFRGHCPDFHC